MLVLSRKKNESIIVDDSIVITVVEIRGDKVRLGIQAPREVSIHRSEVRDAIASSESAATSPFPSLEQKSVAE
ncbi:MULTISPECIES: carbon storage regulator CsrA [unclassified Schlesneria]|uniref:carbon storage regulator CsrA n=1 Tax=Schlesneria TaxID=656899 RepID=UPI002F1D8D5C